MENIVVLLEGKSKKEEKEFLDKVLKTGLRWMKVNPHRLSKMVVKNYLPNQHPDMDLAYHSAQKFLRSQDAYYWYIQKEVSGRNEPTVFFVVNSMEYKERMQDEAGWFHIRLGGEWEGCDYVVDLDGDVDEQVKNFVRVASEHNLDKYYKEN